MPKLVSSPHFTKTLCASVSSSVAMENEQQGSPCEVQGMEVGLQKGHKKSHKGSTALFICSGKLDRKSNEQRELRLEIY